jgi:hypothetical protein
MDYFRVVVLQLKNPRTQYKTLDELTLIDVTIFIFELLHKSRVSIITVTVKPRCQVR